MRGALKVAGGGRSSAHVQPATDPHVHGSSDVPLKHNLHYASFQLVLVGAGL